MTQTDRFWDEIAEKYARRPVGDEEAYRRKLAITQRNLTPDSNVLEFGCGTGSTALEHAPHARMILATDLSGKMIEIARRKAAEAEVENVRFEQTSFNDLSAPPASFDVVLGLNILHLLPDWPQAIDKAHALLKPGGVFITSTACLSEKHFWLRPIVFIGRMIGKLPTLAFFTAGRLKDEMTRAGFVIEEEWRPGIALFLVARKP